MLTDLQIHQLKYPMNIKYCRKVPHTTSHMGKLWDMSPLAPREALLNVPWASSGSPFRDGMLMLMAHNKAQRRGPPTQPPWYIAVYCNSACTQNRFVHNATLSTTVHLLSIKIHFTLISCFFSMVWSFQIILGIRVVQSHRKPFELLRGGHNFLLTNPARPAPYS